MRIAKVIGAVLVALVLLLVGGALLVAALFDPNDYKGYVTEAFQARTGRTLTIERDLDLEIFPWLAVETGGITIGNAPTEGSERPFATVERAAARLKIMPLLERQIELGTVELDGLELNLARDADLRGNWEDLTDAARGGDSGAAVGPLEPGAARAQGFELEGVRIRSGSIYWRENTDELRYTITGLDVSTGAIGRGEPVAADVALRFRDERSGLSIELSASAAAEIDARGSATFRDLDADLALTARDGPRHELEANAASVLFDRPAQTLAIDALTTETAGVRAAWQLAGTALLDDPALSGTVSVEDASLEGLFATLGWSPPPGVAPEELGDFALAAEFGFRAEPREISITSVDAAMLGMRVRGEGTLTGADELEGRIEIPEFSPGPAVQSLLRSAVPPTVDVSALDRLALATRFDTTLSSGRAALRDLKASVFGATIEGSLEAVPGRGGNVFRGSVRTSRFAPDSFAKAFASMLSDKVDPSELGTMQFSAQFAFDTAADTVTAAPFEAELFGLRGSGELTGHSVSTAATWTGRARVTEFSPQTLLQRFGLPPQPTSDPRALTRASIDTRFEVTATRGRFEDIVLALDDSRITGDFTVDGFENPRYLFTLAVDRVDADRYLPPKARDAEAGETTAGDLELPEENTMRVDGTMQIGDLRLAGMQFAAVGSRIVIGGGDAKLENARARLYGGEFAGNFHVRAAGDEPGLALDGRASNLQLEPLIEALTQEAANVSGIGNFELELAGRGRTVIENVQTAAGNVSFAMRDGAIKGFNLGRTLCTAYNATQQAPGPRGEQPNETRYEVIQGTATVTAGTAQSSDLLARTSFMDIYGSGTLGLVEQRLDYDLDAKLTGEIAIPGCETMDSLIGESIPFNIRGTVTEPTITPDFSKLVQRRIREEVQERLQERLQDRLRDILR